MNLNHFNIILFDRSKHISITMKNINVYATLSIEKRKQDDNNM
jgi:hypothetical protein